MRGLSKSSSVITMEKLIEVERRGERYGYHPGLLRSSELLGTRQQKLLEDRMQAAAEKLERDLPKYTGEESSAQFMVLPDSPGIRTYWRELENLANDLGYAVEWVPSDPLSPTWMGDSNGERRLIRLNREGPGPTTMLRVFAHELGHVLMGHAEMAIYNKDRQEGELEAELFSYFLLAGWGIDSGPIAIPYVLNWTGSDGFMLGDKRHLIAEDLPDIIRAAMAVQLHLGGDYARNPEDAEASGAMSPTVQPRGDLGRRPLPL